MVKAMFVLYRRPDFDMQGFRSYWKDTHGPIAAKIPGLRQYVQNHVLPSPDGQGPVVDGIAELYFDSPEAMGTALATPEAQATFADIPNFLDTSKIGMVVVEAHRVV